MKTIVALCLIAVLSAAAYAQLTRGFISGTITDSTGAAVPNAKITVTEEATGIQHVGVTNQAGVYRFVALEPGVYTVVFEKNGFETTTLEGIELKTAQEVVLSQTLPVAGTAATISVEAAASGAELAKATPSVERTLSQHTIETLPMTGFRDVADLALLSPGTAYLGDGARNVTITANGQRSGANAITIDGVDNVDPQFFFQSFLNSPEAVSEVQVRTNTFSAEYGQRLGAQVSIVSRSGTNRFHGEAWDYYAANWMSAATFVNKSAGLLAVRFSDHQAGGNVGGPIRKNRTFFFALGQMNPHREGVSANGIPTVTIPTPDGYATLSRVPLGPGQTASGRQAALDAIAFLPEIHTQVRRYDQISNSLINGAPVEFGVTRIAQSRPSNLSRLQGRIDHTLSDRNNLSYSIRRNYYDAPVTTAWPFTNNSFGRRFASAEAVYNQFHSLSDTHVFAPSLVNEARLSASRHRDEVKVGDDSSTPAAGIGFVLGRNTQTPFIRPRNSYQGQDILTWTRGRHSLKFGGDLLFVDDTVSGAQTSQWNFNNFQDFINNQANTLILRFGSSVQQILSVRQSYFIQDDFKLRPNLTLNLGARYQAANVPDGLFGARTPEMLAVGMAGPLRPDRNDLSPRFGFSYSPRGGATVIRGGYGIGYGLVYEGKSTDLLLLSSNWNPVLTLDRAQLANAYPILPTRPAPTFDPLRIYTNYQSDATNPTTHFYSVSVQREFARRYILEAGYLGNRTYHLYVVNDLNPSILTAAQAQQVIATKNSGIIPSRQQRSLYPTWGPRISYQSSGLSNYNAGYLKIDRRFAHGLLVGANYTWSANLGAGDENVRAQNVDELRSEYGRSSIDIPHRFMIHYTWETPGTRFYSRWRIAGISQWQSGLPFSIVTGVDSNGNGDSATDRPNYNPAGGIKLDPVSGDWRSFSTPIDGTGIVATPLGTNRLPLQYTVPNGGNLGRNTFRGPGFSLWNMSLAKTFRIAERASFEFRADATNLFNHRNFGAPVSSMNTLNFGKNTTTPSSRVMLLGAKVRF
jgi:hypothetical protein